MSGTDWYLEHRDDFAAQRNASRDLLARIATEAAAKCKAREAAERVREFSEDAATLGRLDGELSAGKPVENMTTRDIRFLLGNEDKKKLWNTFGSSRRARWTKAIQNMPAPPASASQHVKDTYARTLEKVFKRKQETVRGVPKQAGLWYWELCRREVIKTLLNHIPPCSRHCTVEEWSFILDLPSFMPDGTDFDPAGNFKPTRTHPEPDEGAEAGERED